MAERIMCPGGMQLVFGKTAHQLPMTKLHAQRQASDRCQRLAAMCTIPESLRGLVAFFEDPWKWPDLGLGSLPFLRAVSR